REIENEARLGCDHVGEALLIRWMLRHLNVHSHRLAASENLQLDGVSYNVLIKFQRKIAHTANGPTAKAHDHVPDLHSTLSAGSSGITSSTNTPFSASRLNALAKVGVIVRTKGPICPRCTCPSFFKEA